MLRRAVSDRAQLQGPVGQGSRPPPQPATLINFQPSEPRSRPENLEPGERGRRKRRGALQQGRHLSKASRSRHPRASTNVSPDHPAA